MTKNSIGRRIFSVVLMSAGLGWLAVLLADNLTQPFLMLPSSWPWLVAASVLVIMSTAANGVIFYLFLNAVSRGHHSLRQVLQIHYFAQPLRYLPGRIWGIIYQVNATRGSIAAHCITRSNIDLMVYSLIGSSIIALLLISYKLGWAWWILILLAIGAILSLAVLFMGGVNWLLKRSAVFLPAKFSHTLYALADTRITAKRFIYILIVFVASWVLYLMGWMLLSKAYPVYAHVDFITLCAYYTLASVIGIISAITPAGLGVREAAFIIMAGNTMGTDVVAYFALFGRIWLMVLDLSLLVLPLGLYITHRRGCLCP